MCYENVRRERGEEQHKNKQNCFSSQQIMDMAFVGPLTLLCWAMPRCGCYSRSILGGKSGKKKKKGTGNNNEKLFTQYLKSKKHNLTLSFLCSVCIPEPPWGTFPWAQTFVCLELYGPYFLYMLCECMGQTEQTTPVFPTPTGLFKPCRSFHPQKCWKSSRSYSKPELLMMTSHRNDLIGELTAILWLNPPWKTFGFRLWINVAVSEELLKTGVGCT